MDLWPSTGEARAAWHKPEQVNSKVELKRILVHSQGDRERTASINGSSTYTALGNGAPKAFPFFLDVWPCSCQILYFTFHGLLWPPRSLQSIFPRVVKHGTDILECLGNGRRDAQVGVRGGAGARERVIHKRGGEGIILTHITLISHS